MSSEGPAHVAGFFLSEIRTNDFYTIAKFVNSWYDAKKGWERGIREKAIAHDSGCLYVL